MKQYGPTKDIIILNFLILMTALFFTTLGLMEKEKVIYIFGIILLIYTIWGLIDLLSYRVTIEDEFIIEQKRSKTIHEIPIKFVEGYHVRTTFRPIRGSNLILHLKEPLTANTVFKFRGPLEAKPMNDDRLWSPTFNLNHEAFIDELKLRNPNLKIYHSVAQAQ